MSSLKHCSQCNISKDKKEFYKDKNKKDGLQPICISCSKEWRINNPERCKVNYESWVKRNPERNRRNSAWSSASRADRKKGLATCSKEEFYKVLDVVICFYCGFSGPIGVDRMDNTRGHVLGNMVPCCGLCNAIKSNVFTVDEMIIFGLSVRFVRLRRNIGVIISEGGLRTLQKSYVDGLLKGEK